MVQVRMAADSLGASHGLTDSNSGGAGSLTLCRKDFRMSLFEVESEFV